MNLRTASRLSVIALVVVVGAILYITRGTWAAPGGTSLAGTALGGAPAPEFELTDQRGKSLSLAQLRGTPVILTFMSTQCDSSCDQEASSVHAALSRLGAAGAHVAVLVVSLDASADTPATVAAFAERLGITSQWHYLTGSCEALGAAWKAYGVAGAGCGSGGGAGEAQSHAVGLYMLDAQGRERVFLDSSFVAAGLATDLRTVGAE